MSAQMLHWTILFQGAILVDAYPQTLSVDDPTLTRSDDFRDFCFLGTPLIITIGPAHDRNSHAKSFAFLKHQVIESLAAHRNLVFHPPSTSLHACS